MIGQALHVAVLNAARRIKDPGLRDRVLAMEGQAITEEFDRQLDRLRVVLERPWVDEFGRSHPGPGQESRA